MIPAVVTIDIRPQHAALVMQLVQRGVECRAILMDTADREFIAELTWSLQLLARMHRAWLRREAGQ